MKRKTIPCQFCNRNISLSNILAHELSCSKPKKVKVKKIRGIDFDPNGTLTPVERMVRAQKAQTAKQASWVKKFEINVQDADYDDLTLRERRERILREQNHRCAMCDIDQTWNGQPITFDLDHVNGKRQDESRKNLRLICPNCHSQTPTFKGRNIVYKRRTDEEAIEAILSTASINAALLYLGMNCQGGNYTRIRKIVEKYNLKVPEGYGVRKDNGYR